MALDQGTTSSRALVIDHDGRCVCEAQKEFKQHFPKPGLVEHDAMEIWTSQAAVIAEALAKGRLSGKDLVGIGITNQRETTVIWDRATGEPIYNAIVWQDRRTTDYCKTLKMQGKEKVFREKTGLLLDPYFSGTKIHWLLSHVEGARTRAERGELAFGTIDTWLIWKLTEGKVHVTDPSNASRTLLFNIHTGAWDEELLKILDIPAALLPEVASSSEVYGKTDPEVLRAQVPICGIAGDQQAALFGQACLNRGMIKATFGTGSFILMHTGTKPVSSRFQMLTTVAWKIGDKIEYAIEGSVFMAGAGINWMRDSLKLIDTAAECDALAAKVDSSECVYFVPAFTGLGAPHWDPHARAAIFGMSRGTTNAHIARALLEGIAFQVSDVIEAMIAESKLPVDRIRVDGGMVKSDLFLQIQSDTLSIPIERPKASEMTALGAAFLAGLAVGYWESTEEIARVWELDKEFLPKVPQEMVAEHKQGWKRAIKCVELWGNPNETR